MNCSDSKCRGVAEPYGLAILGFHQCQKCGRLFIVNTPWRAKTKRALRLKY
jgi:hypothetical protein